MSVLPHPERAGAISSNRRQFDRRTQGRAWVRRALSLLVSRGFLSIFSYLCPPLGDVSACRQRNVFDHVSASHKHKQRLLETASSTDAPHTWRRGPQGRVGCTWSRAPVLGRQEGNSSRSALLARFRVTVLLIKQSIRTH